MPYMYAIHVYRAHPYIEGGDTSLPASYTTHTPCVFLQGVAPVKIRGIYSRVRVRSYSLQGGACLFTTSSRGAGDTADHANLLCSLLLVRRH